MTQKDYENKIEELQQQMQKLQKANLGLVNHNLQLSKQINAFYDVRRRVHMLKELVKRHLQTELSWGIAACAQEAGFSVVRTYNRKFQDALGMTPHEFRMLIEEGAEQVKEVTGKI